MAQTSLISRDDAWRIVCEFVESQALRQHMLCVESAMRHYAEKLGEDADLWGIVGLLHDFDYERWCQPPDHTREGARILRERGVSEEIVGAVLSHAEWNHDEYPLDRPLRKTLSAVDELCGFIYAIALIRPTKLEGLESPSVKKKMKTPSFAASVSREDIVKGAELMGVPLEEHITNCISAIRRIAKDVALA